MDFLFFFNADTDRIFFSKRPDNTNFTVHSDYDTSNS